MSQLPNEIKLTDHARQRLEERNNINIHNYYNTKNLIKSSCKWYRKEDLILDCALYRHCCYVCRKSKQFGYITDGNIEVIYNKETKTAITILEVKDKFKPITQYINPGVLKQIKIKKEKKEMKKRKNEIIGDCPDCGAVNTNVTATGIYKGLCHSCTMRKQNAKARGRVYVPYKDLPEEKKHKVDCLKASMAKYQERKSEIVIPEVSKIIPDTKIENYYQVKAEQNSAIAQIKEIPIIKPKETFNPLSDQASFVAVLRECGCEIPQENLEDVLNVLTNTDKLKDVFMTIAKSDSQQAMLDLEQALNVIERKLQHNWEYNGFQEADDIKFKSFLTWRRMLKGAIFFWKKLYQTNALIEMQRAWNAYTQDPNDKILLAGDRIDSTMKRYQITTESISTIFNTRRPFTRVFYATDKDTAYDMFKQWMADRNLHEDPKKTTIVELKNEGEDGRNDK